ncbi:MAG TPA: crotonase/enoyl-CoA hydratase family protein [Acidimicrobiia bacterium]|nr:crotonase/enoyl-CoA hydratase family protein [Acidimicrobiia bacterium]
MSVTYQRHGLVAVVTIDRPRRRNAIDRATAHALGEAWTTFEADDEARVGVLFGAGGVFSAGADLKSFDLVDDDEGPLGFTRRWSSKPTIAAIEGYCVAGGLEMALWCDLRVADKGAVFGCFERRFGVPLIDGGTQRLPRLIGLSRALDMILTGRPVEAEEALAIGLANRVVPVGQALTAAIRLAESIASFPQPTLLADRQAAVEGFGLAMLEALALERRLGSPNLEAASEGAARFAAGEGRQGTF